MIVIHKLSTFANRGLDTLDGILYNARMTNPNDNGNDPSAYERLAADAMADSHELDDDCDQLEAHEELGDPEYVNWEHDYYGNDADGDDGADDWPF